jgi:hypothetical protein
MIRPQFAKTRTGRPLSGPRVSGHYDSLVSAESTAFIQSLMETDLYSMGAFFSDQHPDLVDEVVERSVAIEDQGLEAYSAANGSSVEEAFQTLLTGLAVRYYKAVAG